MRGFRFQMLLFSAVASLALLILTVAVWMRI